MRILGSLALLSLAAAVGIAGANQPGPAAPTSPGDAGAKPADGVSRPTACVVTAKTIEIPAQEPGQIKELKAEEGDEVSEKALLALIDDSQAQAARKIAYYKLSAAVEEAGNDVSVRYAKKGRQLAETEYEQGLDTWNQFKGAISKTELNRLRFKVEETKLGIEEAEHKLGLAAITADARRAELDAAELDIRRRQIRAPCTGRVEKRHREVGEWVKPGDAVIQLLKLDVVYVQGYVDANRLTPADVDRQPVKVWVDVKGRRTSFDGRIIFASAKVDASRRSLVKAEVNNAKDGAHWILRDGMEADMEFAPRRP